MGGDTSNRASGPLSGMRIIDMTSVLMGPYATQMLGDYGADVIKVESPEGDLMRLGGAMRNPKMGSIYLQANRNKRSIVLDVKTEAGRNALLELCRTADALIHNVRTAAMARLRLTYEDIRAVNAEIVYTALVGYGENGPYAGKPAYDDLIQGISAIPSLFSQEGRSEPRFVPINIADRIVGLNAAHAILAALLCREQTGKGQSVEVPMFETMTQFVLGDHFGGLSFVPPEGPAGYIGSFPRIAAPTRPRTVICACSSIPTSSGRTSSEPSGNWKSSAATRSIRTTQPARATMIGSMPISRLISRRAPPASGRRS